MNIHSVTPLIESLAFKNKFEAKVWLKMEALQPCGSFKVRGIGFACQHYLNAGAKGFISSSGGNAGLAVAYCARILGVTARVVVPKTTKQQAIDLIRREGAEVIVQGDVWIQAHEYALSLADEEHIYIHPFDNPLLWQGHASLIDEVKAQGVKPDLIVLSVGGGGLMNGVVQGLETNQWQDIPVVAVETQGANSLAVCMDSGVHSQLDTVTSVATSLGATKISEKSFEILSNHNIYSHVVTDAQAVNACLNFLDDQRVLVEPACGASLSVVYENAEILRDKKNILVIVCGGVGTTVQQLQQWHQSL